MHVLKWWLVFNNQFWITYCKRVCVKLHCCPWWLLTSSSSRSSLPTSARMLKSIDYILLIKRHQEISIPISYFKGISPDKIWTGWICRNLDGVLTTFQPQGGNKATSRYVDTWLLWSYKLMQTLLIAERHTSRAHKFQVSIQKCMIAKDNQALPAMTVMYAGAKDLGVMVRASVLPCQEAFLVAFCISEELFSLGSTKLFLIDTLQYDVLAAWIF